MTKHTRIKLPFMLWKEQHERFEGVLDEDSYLGHVPNSIPSLPYKPHPQFTIDIFGNKITVWTDVNAIGVEEEPRKEVK